MQTLTKGKHEWLSYIKIFWDFLGGPDSMFLLQGAQVPSQVKKLRNRKCDQKIKINK